MDLREYLSEEVQAVHKHTTYDLIANIVHDGKPSEGSYRIHVLHHVSGADIPWHRLAKTSVVYLTFQRAALFSLLFLYLDFGILQVIELSSGYFKVVVLNFGCTLEPGEILKS